MDFPWMHIYITWAQDYKYVNSFYISWEIKKLLKKNLEKMMRIARLPVGIKVGNIYWSCTHYRKIFEYFFLLFISYDFLCNKN